MSGSDVNSSDVGSASTQSASSQAVGSGSGGTLFGSYGYDTFHENPMEVLTMLSFVIILTIVFEVGKHVLESRINHAHHYQEAVQALYSEIMLLGLISFMLLLALDVGFLRQFSAFNVIVFELVHFLLFFLGITHSLAVCLLFKTFGLPSQFVAKAQMHTAAHWRQKLLQLPPQTCAHPRVMKERFAAKAAMILITLRGLMLSTSRRQLDEVAAKLGVRGGGDCMAPYVDFARLIKLEMRTALLMMLHFKPQHWLILICAASIDLLRIRLGNTDTVFFIVALGMSGPLITVSLGALFYQQLMLLMGTFENTCQPKLRRAVAMAAWYDVRASAHEYSSPLAARPHGKGHGVQQGWESFEQFGCMQKVPIWLVKFLLQASLFLSATFCAMLLLFAGTLWLKPHYAIMQWCVPLFTYVCLMPPTICLYTLLYKMNDLSLDNLEASVAREAVPTEMSVTARSDPLHVESKEVTALRVRVRELTEQISHLQQKRGQPPLLPGPDSLCGSPPDTPAVNGKTRQLSVGTPPRERQYSAPSHSKVCPPDPPRSPLTGPGARLHMSERGPKIGSRQDTPELLLTVRSQEQPRLSPHAEDADWAASVRPAASLLLPERSGSGPGESQRLPRGATVITLQPPRRTGKSRMPSYDEL
eukprot:TRINITY_DN18366_c0_g1_i2.p1 TRINITY_DN18366_c0_g1~~TRINITY_DN18366_c0_g1_i2.p1  ORF type:complete len:676 (+),score=209.40 TRINITY_DN18366_c0_g1_i2:94-2028(+)